MKPEVTKIFDDLDEWRDHCRFNLIKFDEKDLYRSKEYKEWQKEKNKSTRHFKREHRSADQLH